MKIDQKIFKAYDIRGVYPEQINEEVAYSIGLAYAKVFKPSKPVVVGMDVRTHSEALKSSLVGGLVDGGIDVVDIGLVSTEMMYFAVGNYNYGGGIQVTASHNVREYNGFKMVGDNVIPISLDNGIDQIKNLIIKRIYDDKKKKGKVFSKEVLDDFAKFVVGFVDSKKIGSFKIAYNPNFGFEGVVLNKVKKVGGFDFKLVGLNNVLDGTFPKGQPDPFQEQNRIEFSNFVKKSNVDIGVAWDADADRVFFFDKYGNFIHPYHINAFLIDYMLKKHKGGKIVYDPRYTWALIDFAKKNNGEAILERVGHSFIKATMRKNGAIFSGESSGHTYFKDFWYSDTGIIPLLIVLEIISNDDNFWEKLKKIQSKYLISGEINRKVEDDGVFARLKQFYFDAKISEIDGLSIEYSDWRANIRKSNTESLLRINIEATNQFKIDKKKEEIGKIIDGAY
ncbi:MAG TPA: phosphomannomutase/phosphoglucomutase [Candidatus Pacearchaeota archaeon]|jgi:phosphomannomutase|nr:phosphomannomutase/phosphoglucomutase [Candidatus Pacearchaeota archaeon]